MYGCRRGRGKEVFQLTEENPLAGFLYPNEPEIAFLDWKLTLPLVPGSEGASDRPLAIYFL